MQENDEIEAANNANYLVLLLFSEFMNQFYSVVLMELQNIIFQAECTFFGAGTPSRHCCGAPWSKIVPILDLGPSGFA